MRLKTFLLLTIALGLHVSCSADKRSPAADLPIAVHPSIHTRATETAFEQGDKIGVTIKLDGEATAYKTNAELTHNGSYFVSQEIKWYSEDVASTFEAYHPFDENYSKSFSVVQDQSTTGYYESDLLLAYAENVKPNVNGVSLTFVHCMSRLIVRIDNQSQHDISAVRIRNTRGDVTVNPSLKTATVKVFSNTIEISAQKIDSDIFRAILAPQEAAIEIEIENELGTTVTKTFKTISMSGGESYTANVTVSDDFDISDYQITSDGQIEGWEDGGDLTGE
ncbi:MAG: fimbrillin family protein [Rikenellaceae bacterium]|nr:fimbrillin family protein [Rikenellaceae bacterium]